MYGKGLSDEVSGGNEEWAIGNWRTGQFGMEWLQAVHALAYCGCQKLRQCERTCGRIDHKT
jgi:hypothetical protein